MKGETAVQRKISDDSVVISGAVRLSTAVRQ